MIQAALHTYRAALIDDYRPDEAEEDLRDAVVEESGQFKFDTAPIEEVEDYAAWLCDAEEAAYRDEPEWAPDDLPELEQAFLRRLFDHQNDLREEEPRCAAE